MTENPLGVEKIAKLLRSFAIPSITATLVGSIYNIVDQIFIGQGVGYLGNAATNVSYPLSTICLAIALLIGVGSASRFSICLGQKEPERAAHIAGNAIFLMVMAGILYLIVGEAFLTPLLRVFGATDEVMPFAQQYAGITLIGMPFLILTNGISNLIRADGTPRYSMICMVAGAIVNTILDPVFIFVFHWGGGIGRSIGDNSRAIPFIFTGFTVFMAFSDHTTHKSQLSNRYEGKSSHFLYWYQQQYQSNRNYHCADRFE